MKRLNPYHQVDVSPWPVQISIASFIFTSSIILIQQGVISNTYFWLSLLLMLLIAIGWWRDVIREGMGGYHTSYVSNGLTLGTLLFFISEIMLFFSFFWGFFHSSLSPTLELGSHWPPIGIDKIDVWSIPLLGTILLLSSGFTVTIAHNSIYNRKKSITLISLLVTIILGSIFVGLQAFEYYNSNFTVSDSVYGSVFFLTTGLHGLHVIVGVLFLIVSFIRLFRDNYTIDHHLGFEFSILYFHQVDLIWIFVFFFYYFLF